MSSFLMNNLTVVYYGLFAFKQKRKLNTEEYLQEYTITSIFFNYQSFRTQESESSSDLTNAHTDKLHSANKPM